MAATVNGFEAANYSSGEGQFEERQINPSAWATLVGWGDRNPKSCFECNCVADSLRADLNRLALMHVELGGSIDTPYAC